MTQPLTDSQRKAIHDLALNARELLTREARELLEGTYGLYPDGRLDQPEKLPRVQADAETGETYRRLGQFLDDEARAGLPRAEAVDKLVKEVAFTHLNRMVAFKMMEARRLIRGTVDRGAESNGFKFYLADPEHAGDYALYQAGDIDTAYRHFLLWQSAQIAAEVRVLFDPETLPSRLFPRPRALQTLLAMLNRPELADIWRADETVGWVYQYFNEPELQAAFEKVRTSGAKFETKDIPSATQLFTPHWIVRFLVQNTLGRLWVQMHPDTRLIGTELLDYLVPLQGEVPREPLRLVKELTLLDPAGGTMHFGLVAFDLFAAMYQEEMDRAGEPGWPETPSVADPADIPAAIVQHNLFCIDIDLRAVQLSALALYLKAKSVNPQARITDSNLACADVRPLDGARLGAFLREARFTRPVYERLIRALWERLKDANQLGSLLRLEQEIGDLIAQERARVAQTPLFAGLPGEFEHEAAEEEFWGIISAQIVQGLDEFARRQAQSGIDQAFFAGEAVKGLRLVDLMLRRYDVVVTNPPYLSRRKMNKELAGLVGDAYPEAKGDFYACFIQRCLEFAEKHGYVGMLTMHSFMFIGSYEPLRTEIRRQATIGAVAHCGPGLFDVGNPGTLQTTAFALHKEPETLRREANVGTYFRLVHELNSETKRQAFEQALRDGNNTYCVAQRRFDAIPGSPWVYWVSDAIRVLFERLPQLSRIAEWKRGCTTTDNFRFVRGWWEVTPRDIDSSCQSLDQAARSVYRWFPYAKSFGYQKWYGPSLDVVNWANDGAEIKQEIIHRYPYLDGKWEWVAKNVDCYFRPGVTYSSVISGSFSARYMTSGAIFDQAANALFADDHQVTVPLLGILNSSFAGWVLRLNPTINVVKDDLERIPWPHYILPIELIAPALFEAKGKFFTIEATPDFLSLPHWDTDRDDLATAQARLLATEARIDDEVFRLYDISGEDRAAIETELAGGTLAESEEEETPSAEDKDTQELEALMTREELAVRWISYAMGTVFGRFQPGLAGKLGSAIYHRADFAVGSLPEPDEAEFDELVGPPERFAYADAEGGRHLFSAQAEATLRALAVPDGITVLDKGHPRDLPVLVEHALTLMLGEGSAREAITEGAGGDLRAFLSRDYFTRWHLKWYHKRPVYWPLQSARRSYGFVLFHERVDRMTLYTLQRDYLDHKLNGLRLQIGDLTPQLERLAGRARKEAERQIDQIRQLLEELTAFAATMERIVREGYEPGPDWIDDGVILRLAPLWELVSMWRSEPRKYWDRLQQGDFDWSHIAMRYWPERVREKCKANKSFAIAHGHEEWYGGT